MLRSDARRHFLLTQKEGRKIKGVRGIRNRWKQKSIISPTLITQQTDEKWEGGGVWVVEEKTPKRWESKIKKEKKIEDVSWWGEFFFVFTCVTLWIFNDKTNFLPLVRHVRIHGLSWQINSVIPHGTCVPSLPFILIILPTNFAFFKPLLLHFRFR